MFYEEQMIDGALWCRSRPGGRWRPVTKPHAAAANALLALTDEQRLEAMRWFCSHCGCEQHNGRICQCWNDE
jgi:hypothetical protein